MIPVPKGKVRVTIRVDEEVIAWFRSQVEEAGGNYQMLIDDALRQYIGRAREPLEATLLRVIRERSNEPVLVVIDQFEDLFQQLETGFASA